MDFGPCQSYDEYTFSLRNGVKVTTSDDLLFQSDYILIPDSKIIQYYQPKMYVPIDLNTVYWFVKILPENAPKIAISCTDSYSKIEAVFLNIESADPLISKIEQRKCSFPQGKALCVFPLVTKIESQDKTSVLMIEKQIFHELVNETEIIQIIENVQPYYMRIIPSLIGGRR